MPADQDRSVVYEISNELILEGLKAINAIPQDALLEVREIHQQDYPSVQPVFLVKVTRPDFRAIQDGGYYPRWQAIAGCPVPEEALENDRHPVSE